MKLNLNTIDKINDFSALMSKIDGNIDLVSGRYVVNAKSILGIFSLDLSQPVTIKFNETPEQERLTELLCRFEA